jgi:hypothetical protein
LFRNSATAARPKTRGGFLLPEIGANPGNLDRIWRARIAVRPLADAQTAFVATQTN